MEAGRPGCQCPTVADDGRVEEPGERLQEDQRELRRKIEALGVAAALLIAAKKSRPTRARQGGLRETGGRRKALKILNGAEAAGARARGAAVLSGLGVLSPQVVQLTRRCEAATG